MNNDKSLALSLRRVRKTVRTGVDTGQAAPPTKTGTSGGNTYCGPDTCTGTCGPTMSLCGVVELQAVAAE